jgi:hypothetical protein
MTSKRILWVVLSAAAFLMACAPTARPPDLGRLYDNLAQTEDPAFSDNILYFLLEQPMM